MRIATLLCVLLILLGMAHAMDPGGADGTASNHPMGGGEDEGSPPPPILDPDGFSWVSEFSLCFDAFCSGN